MKDSFKMLDEKRAIDVAYLCVKEGYSRIQGREKALLSFAKEWNIPTVWYSPTPKKKPAMHLLKKLKRLSMKNGALKVLSKPM
ncbi:hypothetical protein VN0966_10980 [Helicobacter pylori]